MIRTLLKTLGFGFAVTGLQDQLLQNDDLDNANTIYNLCALTVGTVMWVGGCYLEKRQSDRNISIREQRLSTKIIKQCLSHACGLGLVTSVTHFIKKVDTTSGNLAVLGAGMLGPVAIQELTKIQFIQPTIPWEKSRLFILIAGDFTAAMGAKAIINEGNANALTITALCAGVLISVAESCYGMKKDRGLDFSSIINRRVFKINAGVNLLFTLLDIITLDNDKYTIADDVFITLCSFLLFATLLELRAIAKAEQEISMLRRESNYQQALERYGATRTTPRENNAPGLNLPLLEHASIQLSEEPFNPLEDVIEIRSPRLA